MMIGNYLTHSMKMLTENCVPIWQYLEELVIFSALERELSIRFRKMFNILSTIACTVKVFLKEKEVHTRKLENEHSKSTSGI